MYSYPTHVFPIPTYIDVIIMNIELQCNIITVSGIYEFKLYSNQ